MQNKIKIVKEGQEIALDNLIAGSANKPINAIKVNYGNNQSAFVYNTYEVPLKTDSFGEQSIDNTGDHWLYYEDYTYVNVNDLPITAEKRANTYISIPAGTFFLDVHYDRTIGADGDLPLRIWYPGGKIKIPETTTGDRLYLVPDFGLQRNAWQFSTQYGRYFNYNITSGVGVKFEAPFNSSGSRPGLLIPLTLAQDFLTGNHAGVSSNARLDSNYVRTIDNIDYYQINYWAFNTYSSGDDMNNYIPNPSRTYGITQPYDLYIANDFVKTYNRFKNNISASTGVPSGESIYSGYPSPVSSSDYSYSVYRAASKIESNIGITAIPSKNSVIYLGDVFNVSAQVFDTTNFKVSSLTGSPIAINYSINTDAQKVGTITISQNQGVSCTIQRITKSATTTINLGKPSYDSKNDKYYLDKTVSFPGGSNTYITKITIDSITPSDITISSPSINGSSRTIRFYNSSINPSHAGDDIIVTYTYKYYISPLGV